MIHHVLKQQPIVQIHYFGIKKNPPSLSLLRIFYREFIKNVKIRENEILTKYSIRLLVTIYYSKNLNETPLFK